MSCGKCKECVPAISPTGQNLTEKVDPSVRLTPLETQASDNVLPQGSAVRKAIPLARGVLDYFPAVFIEMAKLSKAGNDKHNPGEELHHARGKSTDHADCIMRHLTDRGTIDPEDGILHDIKVAWRACAQAQEACEKILGYPKARGAR